MDTGLFKDALDGFGGRLAQVGPDHWASPTPCADWDVRTLANHVVAEVLWVPPLLEGKTIAGVGDRFDGDVLGDDPMATWAAAVRDALASAGDPRAQDRTVHLSFGDFPGSEYLGQVTSDLAIHSWDLARALGADDRLGGELFEFVDTFLGPQLSAWRSAGAFGPAARVGPDAGPQERFLAETGRSPDWHR
jgi:uncharacterized protein (TIGR03086 family)